VAFDINSSILIVDGWKYVLFGNDSLKELKKKSFSFLKR